MQTARDAGCDMVIAIGGARAINAGKALAALLANPSATFLAVPTVSAQDRL